MTDMTRIAADISRIGAAHHAGRYCPVETAQLVCRVLESVYLAPGDVGYAHLLAYLESDHTGLTRYIDRAAQMVPAEALLP